jgi:hypothetical protein
VVVVEEYHALDPWYSLTRVEVGLGRQRLDVEDPDGGLAAVEVGRGTMELARGRLVYSHGRLGNDGVRRNRVLVPSQQPLVEASVEQEVY